MAHLCTFCGTDCSGLRAPPDPVYALPVVICRGCGGASVRRRTRERWVGAGAGVRVYAAWVLVLRALALLVLAGIGSAVVLLDAEAIRVAMQPGMSQRMFGSMGAMEGAAFTVALSLICLPVIVVGLRGTLGHHGRTRRTLVWLGLVALLIWVVPNVMLAADAWFMRMPRYVGNRSTVPGPAPRLEFQLGHWLWVVVLGLFTGGVWAMGPMADRFGKYTRRQAWLTRLAKARRRRDRRRS